MLHKDKRRALRRWRSRCAWTRRFWWIREHYPAEWLTPRRAGRHKDTASMCSCHGCGNPRRWYDGKTASALPLRELALEIGDRESWSNHKRNRTGFHNERIQCWCGYLHKIVRVANGATYGCWRTRYPECPDCKRKRALSGEFYKPQ